MSFDRQVTELTKSQASEEFQQFILEKADLLQLNAKVRDTLIQGLSHKAVKSKQQLNELIQNYQSIMTLLNKLEEYKSIIDSGKIADSAILLTHKKNYALHLQEVSRLSTARDHSIIDNSINRLDAYIDLAKEPDSMLALIGLCQIPLLKGKDDTSKSINSIMQKIQNDFNASCYERVNEIAPFFVPHLDKIDKEMQDKIEKMDSVKSFAPVVMDYMFTLRNFVRDISWHFKLLPQDIVKFKSIMAAANSSLKLLTTLQNYADKEIKSSPENPLSEESTTALKEVHKKNLEAQQYLVHQTFSKFQVETATKRKHSTLDSQKKELGSSLGVLNSLNACKENPHSVINLKTLAEKTSKFSTFANQMKEKVSKYVRDKKISGSSKASYVADKLAIFGEYSRAVTHALGGLLLVVGAVSMVAAPFIFAASLIAFLGTGNPGAVLGMAASPAILGGGAFLAGLGHALYEHGGGSYYSKPNASPYNRIRAEHEAEAQELKNQASEDDKKEKQYDPRPHYEKIQQIGESRLKLFSNQNTQKDPAEKPVKESQEKLRIQKNK